MEGCLAPSEIPGVNSAEASTFGNVVENIVFADYCEQFPPAPNSVFWDQNNPAAYLYFLASHNPHFTAERQRDYFIRAGGETGLRVPDILVDSAGERGFYEIKPDSESGVRAGVEKVGNLLAIYKFYDLRYQGGVRFTPRDRKVAFLRGRLEVTLKTRRAAPGLLLYKICLKSDGVIELASLAVLLSLVVRELNKQLENQRLKPIDLDPVFAKNRSLWDVARAVGLAMGTAAATAVVATTWRHFWKAVVARFALRAGTAAALAAADGPLPIGDLVALGLGFWTIIDIIRLNREIWREAELIAKHEA